MKTLTDDKRGFTLIELLVVIAIISLLVTILMPSLQKAKELARNTICCTNLNGIGKAIYYYLKEFEGTFPVWEQWDEAEPDGTMPDITWWYMDLAKTMSYSDLWTHYPAVDVEEEETWEDPGLFLCPMADRSKRSRGENAASPGWHSVVGDSMGPSEPRPTGGWWVELLSYSWNSSFGSYGGQGKTNKYANRVKAGNVINAHEKIMVSDSDGGHGRDSAVGGSGAGGEPDQERAMGDRHNGGSNLLFADSHVDWGDRYEMQCSWQMGSGYIHPMTFEGENIRRKHWSPRGR